PDDLAVVVVVDAVVVVVVGPDAPVVGVVVGAVGAVVVVVSGAVVPSTTCTRASSVDAGTLGSGFEAGPKPTVISWRFLNLRLAGFEVYSPPSSFSSLPLCAAAERVQVRARTTPT